MKQIFSVVICLLFVWAITSCNGGSNSEKRKPMYSCVLYEDNNGELKNELGKRVCAVKIYSRSEPVHMNLSQKVDWNGIELEDIYLEDGKVYSEFPFSSKELMPIGTYNMSLYDGELNYDFFPSSTEDVKEIADNAKREKEEAEKERKKAEEERQQWNNSDTGKGWKFLRNHLKSPSTAELVGYNGTDNESCKEFARSIDLPGLSVATYEVDAQNSYGAMLRKKYFVFFKNGEPIHVEEAESVVKAVQTHNFHLIRTTLKINGY